jgi:hypothetical protein
MRTGRVTEVLGENFPSATFVNHKSQTTLRGLEPGPSPREFDNQPELWHSTLIRLVPIPTQKFVLLSFGGG